MKKNKFFFIWVLLLAIGIMVVITATQIVASRSQVALEQGNKQAVTTFNINNRLEELTSLSYALENKILSLKDKPRSKNTDGLADSLTQLGYNVSVLQKLWVQEAKSDRLNTLVKYINDQIDFSLKLSDTLSNSKIKPVKLIDSFATKHYGDSIYAHALAFQKELERSLSKNFENNNNLGSKINNADANKHSITPSVSLNDIIESNDKIDFLKLDIEAAEADVIESCKNNLHKIDKMFIEYHAAPNEPQRLQHILSILSEQGFRYYIKEDCSITVNPFATINPIWGFDLQLQIFAYKNK